MQGDPFFFGCDWDNDNKPRWPLIEQVNRNHEAGSSASLLMPSSWIQIDKPNFSTKGIIHF